MTELNKSVQMLPGVGTKRAEQLGKIGIRIAARSFPSVKPVSAVRYVPRCSPWVALFLRCACREVGPCLALPPLTVPANA